MQKYLNWILVGIAVMILVFSILNYLDKGPRYGMVNLDKILAESPKGKEMWQNIEEKGDEYEQKLNIEARNMTAQKQQERRAFYVKKFEEYKAEKLAEFGKQFDKALADLAKEYKLDGVFTKDALRYSKIDLTEKMIEKLK